MNNVNSKPKTIVFIGFYSGLLITCIGGLGVIVMVVDSFEIYHFILSIGLILSGVYFMLRPFTLLTISQEGKEE